MTTRRQQQQVSLTASTVAFAASFAAWTLFSILGLEIREQLQLNYTQFALLLVAPILSGALARLPSGILADIYGGRRVMFLEMAIVGVALLFYPLASVYWHYLLFGVVIGLAGATFSAGIAFVSSWYDKRRQGTAMGIFGAGDAGAAITNLVAPLAVIQFGSDYVPVAYGAVLLFTAVTFLFLSSEDPIHQAQAKVSRPLAEELAPLGKLRVWRFGLYYFFVFGAFLALTLWLPQFYVEQYGLDLKAASFATLLFTVPAALVRALGGWFADYFGARTINWMVFWICLVCLFFLSYPPTTMTIHGIEGDLSLNIATPMWLFTALVFVMGVAMGFGKASIYRIIYDYFPGHMGAVGGAVGMIGALGGFALLLLFGAANDITGIRTSCFMLLYGGLAGCMILMHFAIKRDEFRQRYAQAQADEFLSL
ncbi:NarK/NasA family nitrate transporter [Pseudohalioglobus sediminis]|uniref:NarK/NasA family nitrate transporter n=1 Tax=Pseudohalioglobus sediminis TaxID=2606449 RepID=A0A5B0WZH4_9GAMM|nr:nitrate/nitrite transporter [Pseudohalioglobus sediminis]KAA1191797.1 NarK/NasA family nitrate transporter [Pseudohalioglobus sediminis]